MKDYPESAYDDWAQYKANRETTMKNCPESTLPKNILRSEAIRILLEANLITHEMSVMNAKNT